MKNTTTTISHKEASNLFHKANLAKQNGLTTLAALLLADHNKMLKQLEAKASR